MKFTVDKEVLLRPLEQVSRALPSRTTIPILNEILFHAGDEGLTLVASDSVMTIKSVVPIVEVFIEEHGAVTLPGKKIVEIVKKLQGDITIEVKRTEAIIVSGKTRFELMGMDADEYPNYSETKGEGFKVRGSDLKDMINKTIFATSKNSGVPILTGILFNISNDKLSMLACDRHRLAKTEMEIESEIDFSVVINAENLSELIKILPDKSEVELLFAPERFVAKTDEFTFISRVLEGAYPDVSKSIPTNFKTLVTLNTKALMETLERVFIIAAEEKTNLIKLVVGEELEIQARTDTGRVVETVDISKLSGEGFTVSLNAKFLLDALKAIDGDETIIHFVNGTSPIVLKGTEQENDLHLILPYRS